jgi:hypothetical protein
MQGPSPLDTINFSVDKFEILSFKLYNKCETIPLTGNMLV